MRCDGTEHQPAHLYRANYDICILYQQLLCPGNIRDIGLEREKTSARHRRKGFQDVPQLGRLCWGWIAVRKKVV